MPKPQLPRYSVSLTLTEAQIERLEEMAGQGGTLDPTYELTLLAALAAYDIMLRNKAELHGETVFTPAPRT